MIRQVYLENQRLVIEIIPTSIRIREVSTLQKSVLSDEIIVAETENKPLIDRHLQ